MKRDSVESYQREILAAPFGCVLASMTIEYSEEPLAVNTAKGDDEGVGVFHVPAGALGLCDGALESVLFWESSIAPSSNHDLPGYE